MENPDRRVTETPAERQAAISLEQRAVVGFYQAAQGNPNSFYPTPQAVSQAMAIYDLEHNLQVGTPAPAGEVVYNAQTGIVTIAGVPVNI